MDIYAEIYRLSKPYWQTRSNDIHLPMAYEYAKALLREYPQADDAIVLPAILMHDNGYMNIPDDIKLAGLSGSPKGWDPNITRLHEIEGVKIAGQILGGLGYAADKIAAIQKIIDGHDSIKTAHSLEDALVKDADKLWRNTCISINITRFWHQRQPAEYLDYLEQSIDQWMLTGFARALAWQQMRTSRQAFERGVFDL
jgi:hypothetical protein